MVEYAIELVWEANPDGIYFDILMVLFTSKSGSSEDVAVYKSELVDQGRCNWPWNFQEQGFSQASHWGCSSELKFGPYSQPSKPNSQPNQNLHDLYKHSNTTVMWVLLTWHVSSSMSG